MTQGIKDKVVVITGASSGLGEATARHLTAEGGSVVLGARRLDRLQALAKYINGRGGKALAVVTDVTQRDQVEQLVDAAVKTYERIDVIINNAGLMPQSLLEHLKFDEWDRMIDVNIKGVLYGIAAALPHQPLGQRPHGVLGRGINRRARPNLMAGHRGNIEPYNIRTTVISPGAVATELPDTITDAAVGSRGSRTSTRRSRSRPIHSRGQSPSP
jgi:NADP-dependent 3-hydroxy acid dehydrogenase YdfG